MATIRVLGDDRVVSGRSLLFRSADAALRASRTVTTQPGVTSFDGGAGEDLFAANGDWWIDNAGRRGQHLYGRRGVMLEVARVDPRDEDS